VTRRKEIWRGSSTLYSGSWRGKNIKTSVWVGRCLAIILWSASPLVGGDDGCKPLSAGLASHVTEYLAHRIVSESGGVPSIISTDQVPGTCYRKLVIQVSGTANHLTLYLSPDRRFLTSTLYDLDTDPKEEAVTVAANVQELLMRDKSPQLSGAHPRIVIVEFGDLQCPYCRRFADWYHALPAELLSETTLVFKHLPLAIHSWAKLAAEYSTCANRQSPTAFWDLANYFLSHQDEITPANIKDKITVALAHDSNADAQDVASCVTTGLGADLVGRDIAVARELGVDHTPSLFLEGRPVPSLHSEEDLRLLLERELKGKPSHGLPAGN